MNRGKKGKIMMSSMMVAMMMKMMIVTTVVIMVVAVVITCDVFRVACLRGGDAATGRFI